MNRKNARILFSLLAIFCLVCIIDAHAQLRKSNLNVLYVGGSGDIYDQVPLPKEERDADIRARMTAFEDMLKKYFNKVAVTHIDKYSADMSSGYDVTIIDALPEFKKGEQLKLFPENFDLPVLFIGETSVNGAKNQGVKFDWYCLCLRGDAFNIRTSHPIFKGPFPVKLTTKAKPLPAEAALLNYREDKTYADPMPMWSVQTATYDDYELHTKGIYLRPGMISHASGFEDSPDAEYIAGGSSAKDAGALAIGRHGNFFHWGFAASPRYLTPEAQTVLANAIVYTAAFKGKRVIAKKLSDRIQTTHDMEGKRDAASEKAKNLMDNYYKALAKQAEDRKKSAQEKKNKGEKLSQAEENFLKSQVQAPEPITLEGYLGSMYRDLYTKYGTDLKAYRQYYDENMPYFYSTAKGEVTIDEDLKSLKIKKGDIKLLDVAIRMLETGKDTEKAKRLLDRYTLATFTKPEDWRKWYEQNKQKFFFTESGGYYYLINSDDKKTEGNDYGKKQQLQAYKSIAPGETSDEHPVSMAAGSVVLDNGNREIVVRLKIHPGYHIYNYVSPQDPFIKTEVKINAPAGYAPVGELKTSNAILYNPTGTSVYKSEALFVQEVKGKAEGEALCVVSYQCCNNDICYPPAEETLKVKL